MLRSKKFNLKKKNIPVPLLRESSQKEVLVDMIDPLSEKKVGERVEFVPVSKELLEVSFVSNEPAEIYDIENQMKVGIKTTVCPTGGYIHSDIGTPFDMEAQCANILDKVNSNQAESQEEQPIVESSNDE